MMKKSIAVILLLVFVFTSALAGCGGSKEAEKETSNAGEKVAESTTTQTDAGQDETEATVADENITWETADLSWKKDTSPVTLSAFIDMSWYVVDTWGKDDISPIITEKTGVTLDITKATTGDSSQLETMIASNQLPDLVYVENSIMFDRLSNSQYSLAYDELMKQYCPEFLKLLDPGEIANNTEEDGHFYSLTNSYASDTDWEDPAVLPSVGQPWLHVREDILKELGNPPLETLDDFMNVLKMVKEKYPDMTPFIQFVDWEPAIAKFMGLPDIDSAYLDNGKVKLGITHPGYLDFYKYMNKMYREGYLPSESYTYNMDQFNQICQSGNVFSAAFNCMVSDNANTVFDQTNRPYHFVPLPAPLKYNGEIKYKPIDSSLGWAKVFISKNCSDPKRAINFLEFLRSPEGDKLTCWGIEGVHYTLDSDGYPIRPADFAKRTYTETGIVQWGWMTTAKISGIEFVGRQKALEPYTLGFQTVQKIKPYIDRQPALAFVNPKPSDTESEAMAKIQEYLRAQNTKIIMSKTEEEAVSEFNKMLDEINKMGLPDVEVLMNEKYSKVITRYQK